jgi:hypothetical protein
VSTNDLWAAYWNSLTSLQRYNDNTSEATAGFDSLKFQTADVIHDLEATNFTSTGEKMYFINSDYLGVGGASRRQLDNSGRQNVSEPGRSCDPGYLAGSAHREQPRRPGRPH